MISYHPESSAAPVGTPFTRGFKTVDTNDPERLARGIVRFAWSPAVFRDGYRTKANFLFADWIGLDFDSPEFSLDEALNAFCDMIHVIGTSRSHQKPKLIAELGRELAIDRFRVVLRLSERCASAERLEDTLRRISRRYPIDRQCIDSARHFFPCREIISISASGYTEDLEPKRREKSKEEISEEDARREARRRDFKRLRVLPPWIMRFLEAGTLVRGGGRNNTIYSVARALAEFGLGGEEIATMIAHAPIDRTRRWSAGREIEAVRNGILKGAHDDQSDRHGREEA